MIMFILGLVIATSIICALMIIVLFPLLKRYALARPNARSSHAIPTPQGAGIAIICAILSAGSLGAYILLESIALEWWVLCCACIVLAITGLVDDLHPLPALPRLSLQVAAVSGLVYVALPLAFHDTRVLPTFVPHAIEPLLWVFVGVWCVNLTNFMDGLDWMSVSEIVPVSLGLSAFFLYLGDDMSAIIALCTAGAMIGFAPFNRPPAKVFMGDVGSLPLGLIVFYLLYRLSLHGLWASALLLPLYYVMDAGITLMKRILKGERIWQAHRSHFYQQATDNGYTALHVAGTVFSLNIVLAGLAILTITPQFQQLSQISQLTCLVCLLLVGCVCVSIILQRFACKRAIQQS